MNQRKLHILTGVAALAAGLGIFLWHDEEPRPPAPETPTASRPDWQAAPPVVAKPPVVEDGERTLKVGVIGPETGPEAALGLAVLDGVRLAAQHFNAAGGLNGKPMEVIHHDSQGDMERTMAAAHDLVGRKVIAIFTAPTGWSTFAPTRLANRSRTIMISVGSRRKIGRSGAFVFRSALSDGIATDELVRFATERLGYTKYALVTTSSYDYSLSLSGLFLQAVQRHGGQLSARADTYNTYTGGRDLDAVIAALKTAADPPQAIIYTGGGSEAARLARALRQAGLTAPLIGGEDLFSAGYLKEGGAAVHGSLLYATFAPDHPSPRLADFLADFARIRKQLEPTPPDRFAALAYDSFNALALAIERAGSLKSAAVRDVLLSAGPFEGVTGVHGWAADGGPLNRPFLYRVAAEGGAEKFVLVSSEGSSQR
ncbi:MAG: ABC transporter substrate-binding protein [Alphaproteobacteria bacterium]|jgi:branched-chain amino acid transport system substrate-binding protein|nr:ABC transporter substrate-binding protein [Alphaproteobacteria bacterium]MDP6814972.1 ABC transporter substrate-binding protein [Alphaproteobacteria bacterium]